jgi:Zn-dependent protease
MISRQSGFPLFTIFGIRVSVHWLWFVAGIYIIQQRNGQYSSIAWNIAEYLVLFVIVLLHEFGHALACRSVGGKADRIMLWPLGGVAYVSPPPRPGAVLWSIAAGPLVNVALLPVTVPLMFYHASNPSLQSFLWTIGAINITLLLFNLLPIYPLDGGQILQALLWFIIGRGRALMVATIIGMIGAVSLAGFAVWIGSLWIGAIAVFAGFQAWRGILIARQLRRSETMPRRPGVTCPSCKASPPIGAFWKCSRCSHPFDPFEHSAVCPTCGVAYRVTSCPDCGAKAPLAAWLGYPFTAAFPTIPPPLPQTSVPPPLPPIL